MSMFEWVFHAIAVHIIIIIIVYVGGGSSSRTAVSYSLLDLALCKMYDEKWSTKLNVAIKLRAQSLEALFRIPSSNQNSTSNAPCELGCSLKVINKTEKESDHTDDSKWRNPIHSHTFMAIPSEYCIIVKYSWPYWKRVMCELWIEWMAPRWRE